MAEEKTDLGELVAELAARANARHTGEPSPTAQLCARAANALEEQARLVKELTRERDEAREETAKFEAALNSREIELRTIEDCAARAENAERRLEEVVGALEPILGTTDGFFTVAMPSDLRSRASTHREPVEHELKTHPAPFTEVWNGRKRFEFRLNDRDYRVGDRLKLREWEEEDGYTGRVWYGRVTYALYGPDFGVPEGYVVMSLVMEGALYRFKTAA